VTAPDQVYDAVRDRLSARPLVLLLDVDGTLSPIAPSPESATVPAPTREVVRRLATAPDVHVALISGRAARDAQRMVGVDGIWAIGNHGFETITPDGDLLSRPELEPWRERIAEAASVVAKVLEGRDGVLLEDKRWTLSIHFRTAGQDEGERLRPEMERIARDLGLRLTEGKMVFELRPPVKVDKGTASVALADRLLAGSAGNALYAGDDRTDEDAFEALRAARAAAVTVRIAPRNDEAPIGTAAEFVLPDVDAMRAFLERIAADEAVVR